MKPRYPLKGVGAVSLGPVYLGNPAPVRPENPDHPGAYPVRCKNIDTPVPVQSILRLLEVHEYIIEYRLPRGRNLVYQLGIKGSGPRPVSLLKPMYNSRMSNVSGSKMLRKNKCSRIPGWNK